MLSSWKHFLKIEDTFTLATYLAIWCFRSNYGQCEQTFINRFLVHSDIPKCSSNQSQIQFSIKFILFDINVCFSKNNLMLKFRQPMVPLLFIQFSFQSSGIIIHFCALWHTVTQISMGKQAPLLPPKSYFKIYPSHF